MEIYRLMKKGGYEDVIIQKGVCEEQVIKKTCSRCKGCGVMDVKPRKKTIRTKPTKKDDKDNMKCNRCHGYKNKTEFLKKDNIKLYKTCNLCRVNLLKSYHLNKDI